MKMILRRSAMTMAAVLAAVSITAGTGLASEKATHGKAAYERCGSKDHARHEHGKSSKEWKKTLTDEQRSEMKRLHVTLKKELAPMEANIGVKEAEIKTIVVSENPDRAALARLVDEISALKEQTLQSRYDHMIKVRALLTPEQRTVFDIAVMKDGDHGHRHKR